MKLVLLVILSASFQIANSQILESRGEKQGQYFFTLKSMATFLKDKPTKPLSFHTDQSYSSAEMLYDTVIDHFFDKNKMREIFSEGTSVFAVDGKFDIIRHILNYIDYCLDIVPPELILAKQSEDEPNTLDIFFKIENEKVRVLICNFDPGSDKLLSFGITGGMEDKSYVVQDFLKKQKNYYEFPNPQLQQKK